VLGVGGLKTSLIDMNKTKHIKRLSLLHKLILFFALQGVYFYILRISQWFMSFPCIQRYIGRLAVKGWLSQWGFEWLV